MITIPYCWFQFISSARSTAPFASAALQDEYKARRNSVIDFWHSNLIRQSKRRHLQCRDINKGTPTRPTVCPRNEIGDTNRSLRLLAFERTIQVRSVIRLSLEPRRAKGRARRRKTTSCVIHQAVTRVKICRSVLITDA